MALGNGSLDHQQEQKMTEFRGLVIVPWLSAENIKITDKMIQNIVFKKMFSRETLVWVYEGRGKSRGKAED